MILACHLHLKILSRVLTLSILTWKKIDKWAKTWKVSFNERKTDLLNLKKNNSPIHPLSFANTVLQETEHHKHLGITIQNNCKWDTHIANIISKVTPLISCLKHYKYKLSRKALQTMYKSFILPHFDYADVIWDNCSKTLADKLEHLHLDALRTIAGCARGCSHVKLYQETGFCSLIERRRRHKLIFFHKIVNGNVKNYILNCLPPLVSSINPYHRRRPNDRYVPPCKTELYLNSFFPASTRLWNNLPESVQANPSTCALKHHLSKGDTLAPPYYYLGSRKVQVAHTCLRLGMSNINYDLHCRHLLMNPECCCGHPAETAEHFLLHCPLYNNIRAFTISSLPQHLQHVNTLLFGCRDLTIKQNEHVFSVVHNFLSQTDRVK